MFALLASLVAGSWVRPAIAGVISAAVAGSAGFFYGHTKGESEGVSKERGAQAQLALEGISTMLASHQSLLTESAAASESFRTAAAVRAQADAKSLKEMKNALAATAAQRANCVFDDDIVRRLNAARDSAAQAATSGHRTTLPNTTREDRK